jgi:hypothetical protein
LTPAHPLKFVALITMHPVSVTQTVNQTVHFLKKMYTENMTVVQLLIRIVDSLMCIKHIINSV